MPDSGRLFVGRILIVGKTVLLEMERNIPMQSRE
jgi:hypothetical protein